MQGIIAGSDAANRRVGYLTKYLTKSIADTYGDAENMSDARAAHLDRLAAEVRWLPCTPRCAIWLRYGVQPKGATAGRVPDYCPAKAHDREHLGLGGRRVLVSRRWTGKTLTEHRADRAIVRAVLTEAGIDLDAYDTHSATVLSPDGRPRYLWEPVDPNDPDTSVCAQLTPQTRGRPPPS
jgi:hypothetical protein